MSYKPLTDADLAGLRLEKHYDGRCPHCRTRTGKRLLVGEWAGTGSDRHRVEVRQCMHCKRGERSESYPDLLSGIF